MTRNRKKRIEQRRRGRAAQLLWERKQTRIRRVRANAVVHVMSFHR